MKHERGLAYAAFAVVCVVWGTTYMFIRIALETLPPMLLTGSRYVAAGLIMLLVARLRGATIPRDPRTLASLAFVGFLVVGMGNLAVVWAEQWVPSGLAALFVATAPFWMVIIEAFRVGGERVDRRTAFGMLIGFAGVAILVTPGSSGSAWGLWFLLGGLAIQVGAIGWQLGSTRVKYKLQHVPFLASVSLQMLFGGVMVTVAGLVAGEASRYVFSARSFIALAYLAVIGSVIAYSAYMFALNHMRTTHVSLYAYVNPVVAVFLGWLILDEPLTGMSIVAMVVILAGVALVQSSGWRRGSATAAGEAETAKKAA